MKLNLDMVGVPGDERRVAWTSKDTILYALGVGAGSVHPTGADLAYTTENSLGIDQLVLPTFPAVLAPTTDPRAGDFDRAQVVHAGQSVLISGPIPADGCASIITTITGIYDKGSGALVSTETEGIDAETKAPMFRTRSSIFVRGQGGYGGDRGPAEDHAVPAGTPDVRVCYQTRHDQALLYRLSGDRNPLHSDPWFARSAGFDRPILHGLCTFGFIGRAVLHSVCGASPSRLRALSARFVKPVFPGDRLEVSVWLTALGAARYQCSSGSTVVAEGSVEYRGESAGPKAISLERAVST